MALATPPPFSGGSRGQVSRCATSCNTEMTFHVAPRNDDYRLFANMPSGPFAHWAWHPAKHL